MIYVFTVLYALAWGLAGYFTVKFVCARIEKKRAEDAQFVRVEDQRTVRCCLYEMSEKGDTLKCI